MPAPRPDQSAPSASASASARPYASALTLAALALLPLLLLAGCQARPVVPDVGGRAAALAGVPTGVIAFHREGEPVDVPAGPAMAGPGDRLSYAAAIEQALRHDPDIQAALARVRTALADADQVRLLPNPVLSVAVRFPEGGGRASVEAGVAADLLALLTRPRRIDAADARLRAAVAEALVVVLDRLADVQERYAAAQALDAELVVLAEQERLIGRLLELARSRADAGESSRGDVLALDAERLRVEAEVLDALARRRDERLALARLLGRPSGDAEWTLAPWQPPPPVATADEARWVEAALTHRPEVQARRWELAARGDEAALARWAALDGSEAGVEAEREEDWSVGPALSTPLPLFDWGRARRDKADAERVEARHELVRVRRRVVEEVRRSLAALAASQRSLAKVRDELIPVLERRHAQARDAYAAGASGITEVLLAEQELQQARGRLVALQLQASVARSRLGRAVGGPGIAAALHPPPPPTPPTTTTTAAARSLPNEETR